MSSRRVAAIALFHLRVGVAYAACVLQDAHFRSTPVPLAVVVGEQSERDLQGGTRIDEVSPEAFALGVRPGMTVAAARARAASLTVRVVSPQAVAASLAQLAETLFAFGATVSFSAHGAAGVVAADAVFVDVTGCAHLHATAADLTGERVLAAKLAAHVARLGFAARVAIASGPRLAHAVARHTPIRQSARQARQLAPERGPALLPIVVPPGEEREAVGVLPLAALELAAESERFLSKLGLTVVAELLRVPQNELGSRLGSGAAAALLLARGEDRTPLVPYVPPEVPEERVELDDPVEACEALLFLAKALTDRLGARLVGRGLVASTVELDFLLERSLVPEGVDPVAKLSLPLAAPIARDRDLFAIVRARLEAYEVQAPIKAVVLRVRHLSPARGKALALFEAEPKAERVLPELAAELATLLGRERVGVLAVSDSWSLEERSVLVPWDEARGDARIARGPRPFGGEEPLRLLPKAAREEVPFPAVAPLVVRQEHVEWWRVAPQRSGEAHPKTSIGPRDFVVAWDESCGAAQWLELDRATGRAWRRGFKE